MNKNRIVKELELYIHIPFCVRKCAYCDFLSAPADEDTRQKYVSALIKEIQGYKKAYQDYCVSTIFVGGGTPSILFPGQIKVIFSALQDSFKIDEEAEITIEANPGTVTEEKLLAWKEVGVNRLSIGLQSTKDEELRMLGRIHDYRKFLDTWNLIRSAGIENVNVDLISAIPGQTLESWQETLRKIAELESEHLSVYSLIIEEGTPFYDRYGEVLQTTVSQRATNEEDAMAQYMPDKSGNVRYPFMSDKVDNAIYPPLPDEETERLMYEETDKILQEYGYARYEISNYAKPGYECRHNIGYWQRKEYLGIGLGASSLIGKTRFRHIPDLQKYLSAAGNMQNICEEEELLSVKDEMEEFMFLGLRMMCGVRKSEFFRLFGIEMDEVYEKPLKKMKENGLLEIEEDIVRLTKRGIDISNYVFEQFLLP